MNPRPHYIRDKRHIVIHVAPDGKEYYEAYGPMVMDRNQATSFFSEEAAGRAATYRHGHGYAFWNSERQAAAQARQQYGNWSYRVECVELVPFQPQTPA